ncbi:MAG: type II secretion system F family protein [Candidatus Ratteibacteria bacterium]|jgi:type IV pilus assembly protein PilC
MGIFRHKIKLDEIAAFSRQLATMVKAGLPIHQSLGILSEQSESKIFKTVIDDMQKRINTGNSLSETLQQYPRIFSGLYVNMVRAGEMSGTLDRILNRISDYLEANSKLQKKIKAALSYPTAVLVMAFFVTAFLLLKVVPTFKGIFESLGGKLPLPTLVLLKISELFRHYFVFLVIGIIILIYIFKLYKKSPAGGLKIDRLLFRLPVFGKIIKKIIVARFCRTLSTLVRSGVAILVSLKIVAAASGNKVVEIAVIEASKNVEKGQPIAEPLAKCGIFPLMVTRMIAVGEEVGALDEMLEKVADFYETEVDAAVSSLTSLIEPIIMVFLGIVIGGIALAILLPIFKISELVK